MDLFLLSIPFISLFSVDRPSSSRPLRSRFVRQFTQSGYQTRSVSPVTRRGFLNFQRHTVRVNQKLTKLDAIIVCCHSHQIKQVTLILFIDQLVRGKPYKSQISRQEIATARLFSQSYSIRLHFVFLILDSSLFKTVIKSCIMQVFGDHTRMHGKELLVIIYAVYILYTDLTLSRNCSIKCAHGPSAR